MTDAIDMKGTDIDVIIPLTELPRLVNEFYKITIIQLYEYEKQHRITLHLTWEEDSEGIRGYIKDDVISLDKEQYGTLKNSECGGLGSLLKRYIGNGTIQTTSENGEVEVTKYVNGNPKQGKMVFE